MHEEDKEGRMPACFLKYHTLFQYQLPIWKLGFGKWVEWGGGNFSLHHSGNQFLRKNDGTCFCS